ncbi:hypothetical protein OG379_18380 [Streptomyces sp. NBC_01166]|uniref:hypothetical protein n=1 Tax=Streptomyces sp. NBC_01166 TaxID=2903755 RepID=UPI003869DC13|nr:hypothetical protein OG379_18380 [Streptomyces sp. NBC_01166]
MLGAIAAVITAVIAAWATLRARRKRGGEVTLVDVSVGEGEAVLAEPGADAHLLGEVVPDRPVLDIAVRNDGDRKGLVRRIHVELKGLLHVPDIDPPSVVGLPWPVNGRTRAQERRLGPSGSYAVDFPLTEGSYNRSVSQEIDPGDVDRFVISLVSREAARGKDFYQVRLLLDGGRTRRARERVTSEPMTVLAYGPPSWESPAVIEERLSEIADKVREEAPQGSAEAAVFFNAVFHPHATGMEDYVTFYEEKLKVLTAALRACLKHASDGTRIRGWLDELERDLTGVERLRGHAAELRASGRHP